MFAAEGPASTSRRHRRRSGTCRKDRTSINRLKVLEMMAPRTSRFARAAPQTTIVRATTPKPSSRTETTGSPGEPACPSPPRQSTPSAPELLVELASVTPGELVVLALGRMTNLALRCGKDTGHRRQDRRTVLIGVCIRSETSTLRGRPGEPGTTRSASGTSTWIPKKHRRVFDYGLPITRWASEVVTHPRWEMRPSTTRAAAQVHTPERSQIPTRCTAFVRRRRF